MMTVGSLFSGVGGFDLALENVGMTVRWQSEVDRFASHVLADHWPDVPNLGDINNICMPERVDVLCGGFPCQDISRAGHKKGLAGARSGLWFEFARIIGEVEPEWVVIENVAGLLSSNSGRDMGTVVTSLGNMGYGWAYRVLNSVGFGVPQRRRRVFIVGHRSNNPRSAQVLFESNNLRRDTEKVQSTKYHTRTLTKSNTRDVYDGSALAGLMIIDTNSNGDKAPRRLTPLECERLQGFPDNWGSVCSDLQRYKQMGNAVTVPVVSWIGKRIIGIEELPPTIEVNQNPPHPAGFSPLKLFYLHKI